MAGGGQRGDEQRDAGDIVREEQPHERDDAHVAQAAQGGGVVVALQEVHALVEHRVEELGGQQHGEEPQHAQVEVVAEQRQRNEDLGDGEAQRLIHALHLRGPQVAQEDSLERAHGRQHENSRLVAQDHHAELRGHEELHRGVELLAGGVWRGAGAGVGGETVRADSPRWQRRRSKFTRV